MHSSPALDRILAYHRRTKHRFEAYANGPTALDWDAQPAAFRHFDGAPQLALPHLAALAPGSALQRALERSWQAAMAGPPSAAVAPDLASISAWLQLALGITAWKSFGPDRWAVRANPSSGNLHPVEAYLLVGGIDGVADGIHHYRPECHALELRAGHAMHGTHTGEGPLLAVILTSVMWREAWKYGERAFRYCQLDVGHAEAALRCAAAAMGWSLVAVPQIGGARLARWCGIDRDADFPSRRYPEIEREEAESLLLLQPAGMPSIAGLDAVSAAAEWHGRASTIDPHPLFRWPAIWEVAEATQEDESAKQRPGIVLHNNPAGTRRKAVLCETPSAVPPAPTFCAPSRLATPAPIAISIRALINRRRSAQRFDHRHVMSQASFAAILACRHLFAEAAHTALILFVQRVEGLSPGLYLLPRDGAQLAALREKFDTSFEFAPEPGVDGLLRLLSAAPAELQRLTRSLHCHQDIAANACIALGMLCEFAPQLSADPTAYRRLHRDCGAIGQALYLEAEAQGLRGTGIGCFFDDPVHTVLGLADEDWQTLYHFTVGLPIDDPRIETTPAYAEQRDEDNPCL